MSTATASTATLRPLEETIRDKYLKMGLLRRILLKEERYENYSVDELFSLYSTWHLTTQTHQYNQYNQYNTLYAFMNDHPKEFYPLSPDQLIEREERIEQHNLRKQVNTFRRFVRERARAESQEMYDKYEQMYRTRDGLVLQHSQALDMVDRLTIPQIIRLGFTRNFPIDFYYLRWIVEWDKFSALDLQMEPETENDRYEQNSEWFLNHIDSEESDDEESDDE